jgi:hypothetical protein
MATTYKVLGQASPLAATPTILDAVVPTSTSWVVSTITVCNQSSIATAFRISVRKAADASSELAKQFLYYDVVIAGNDTFTATVGLSLATGDAVWVYATLATLSFNLFGSAIT